MKNYRIKIYGIVQGVGFRPFVKREADRLGIRGTVQNKGSYVEIRAYGSEEKIRLFIDELNSGAPERAVVIRTGITLNEEDSGKPGNSDLIDFSIIESEHRGGKKFIPPDLGICRECAAELFDPGNRRYLHPFINCTQCGPRFTILKKLPYDRERTSMASFPMCKDCNKEYYDKESRRFDAQPVCCNSCGPSLYIIGKDLKGKDAVSEVRQVILSGGIAALKGIGGFHLCCNALDEAAVRRLRERKKRVSKPFAVMLRDMDTIRRECRVGPVAEKLLTGYQKPIVLIGKSGSGKIPEAVAPRNPKLGVMLPYAPVQLLLFSMDDGIKDFPDSLIMTSGNVSDAAICISDEEAERELDGIADIFLSNNREILTRADDSVMDIFEGRPYMIRRSRGFAPLPLLIPEGSDPGDASDPRSGISSLALGGELKNSFCISAANMLYPSAYIGDLTDRRSVEALKSGIVRMEELLEAEPEVFISDLHPGYNSSKLAEKLAKERDKPLIKLQHHYAHILSVMAENSFEDPVIGAAFDGTGYGSDGSIWGGEIIKADRQGFSRLSHIKPFKMPGGDAAAKEGWRVALSMIHDHYPGKEIEISEKLGLCRKEEAEAVCSAIDANVGVVMSTSAGRLFDAVSAVLGICRSSSYEGEAASLLQFAAEGYAERKGIDIAEIMSTNRNSPVQGSQSEIMSTDRALGMIVEKALEGVDSSELAFLFHRIFAGQVVSEVREQAEKNSIETTALSGGCFQNLLFLKMVKEGLEKSGLKVLIHSLIPPNDGGISVGQCYFSSGEMIH